MSDLLLPGSTSAHFRQSRAEGQQGRSPASTYQSRMGTIFIDYVSNMRLPSHHGAHAPIRWISGRRRAGYQNATDKAANLVAGAPANFPKRSPRAGERKRPHYLSRHLVGTFRRDGPHSSECTGDRYQNTRFISATYKDASNKGAAPKQAIRDGPNAWSAH